MTKEEVIHKLRMINSLKKESQKANEIQKELSSSYTNFRVDDLHLNLCLKELKALEKEKQIYLNRLKEVEDDISQEFTCRTPLEFLKRDVDYPLALILINRNFEESLALFKLLYEKSICTCYIDGVNNYFFDKNLLRDYPPSLITGDFDSIRPEVLEFCKESNFPIKPTPDQDETDLTKAIKLVNQELAVGVPIFILGNIGGRLDHGLSIFHTIFKAQTTMWYRSITFINESSVAFLLNTGCYRLEVSTGFEGIHCGFIPFDGPCNIETTGVVWPMKGQLGNKGIVSCCNKLKDALIKVSCDDVIIFTLEYSMKDSPM